MKLAKSLWSLTFRAAGHSDDCCSEKPPLPPTPLSLLLPVGFTKTVRSALECVVQAPEVRNWWNIRLAGKTKSIPENNTMWSVLTTASATPVLELDFLGADAHELLGFSDPAKFAALQSGVDPCPLLLCMSDVSSQTDSLQASCAKIVMQQNGLRCRCVVAALPHCCWSFR